MIRTIIRSFFLTGAFISCVQSSPTVKTPLGSILGTIQSSRKGQQFYSFRGIRYAEPPVGDLRFKPPVPAKPWNMVFDATQEGPACYQPPVFLKGPFSEDCLRLNVYTRRITLTENLRPVLVFIHGGAYVIASGQSNYWGPEYLMDHDIVLVTINYRLGTLGFFATGDQHAPGNYGMKDQVEALKWIQNNIACFGGDPKKVTISGESAGAASVGLHMVSPMSRGLFHGAIKMSASNANFWAVDKNPLRLAQKTATLLNCPNNDTKSMVDCIKKLPADRIANIYTSLLGWKTEPIVAISPNIENGNGKTEPFLSKDPIAAMLEGDMAQVPVLIGITKDEFAARAYVILGNKDWADDLSKNWNKIAPISFNYEPNDTISQKLREFYLGSLDQPLTYKSSEALGRLYADAVITFGVVRSAKIMALKNSKPVYLYRFNYEGKNRAVFFPQSVRNVSGVFHGDDLIYIFPLSAKALTNLDANSKDSQCVDRFTALFKNFIETGNPTPEPTELLNNVIWTPLKKSNHSYLEIADTLKVESGIFFKDRMSFWESLFPLSNPH